VCSSFTPDDGNLVAQLHQQALLSKVGPGQLCIAPPQLRLHLRQNYTCKRVTLLEVDCSPQQKQTKPRSGELTV
jgi:hypothetical protein